MVNFCCFRANSVNYETSSDFSLTRLYRRLWSTILNNGPITANNTITSISIIEVFSGPILIGWCVQY